MAQKRVFLREATGLVRAAGTWDVIGFNGLNNQIGFGILWLILWGPLLAPGGDMVIATLIVTVGAIFLSMCWGFLTATMPRSGGDYVWNSRVLHPSIGFATSWSWVSWNYLWSGILSAWVATPGLSTMFMLLEKPDWSAAMTTPLMISIVGAIVILYQTAILLLGIKAYFRYQTIVFALAMLMVIIALVLIGGVDRGVFITKFDAFSAKYGSLTYQAAIDAAKEAGGEIPATDWNATLKLLPVAYWGLAYSYLSAMIGGEIKNVKRTVVIGNTSAAIITGLFMALAAYLYQQVVGYDFLYSIAYAWSNGLAGYNLPSQPDFVYLAGLLTDSMVIRALLGIGYVCWTIALPAMGILAQARIMLAWSFDRVMPAAMGDVNERFHVPAKAMAFFTAAGIVTLVLYAYFWGFLGSMTTAIGQSLTVFLFTAIAAAIFPFVGKVRHIWDSSPVKQYKVGGIPLMSVWGFGYLVFILVVVYYFFAYPEYGAMHIPSLMLAVGFFATGLAWWFGARWYQKSRGIDLYLAYKELPPE